MIHSDSLENRKFIHSFIHSFWRLVVRLDETSSKM